MSGEFGSYMNGYFDTQIVAATEDLSGGKDALSREWSKFFHAFQPIAHAICRSEACVTKVAVEDRFNLNKARLKEPVCSGVG